MILNIPSFAGGLDLWRAAGGKLGLSFPSAEGLLKRSVVQTSLMDQIYKSAHEGQQEMGDGCVEIMTFRSLVELGLSNLQRLMPSDMAPSGWRIFQGPGEYTIHFKENLSGSCRIYFQIDGEYFIGTKIKQVKTSAFKKVRVLVHPSRIQKRSRHCKPGKVRSLSGIATTYNAREETLGHISERLL